VAEELLLLVLPVLSTDVQSTGADATQLCAGWESLSGGPRQRASRGAQAKPSEREAAQRERRGAWPSCSGPLQYSGSETVQSVSVDVERPFTAVEMHTPGLIARAGLPEILMGRSL